MQLVRRWFGRPSPRHEPKAEDEDPQVALARSLSALESELERAGESLRAVAASRRALEAQQAEAGEMVARHGEQAERALLLGREDLARQALELRWAGERRREDLAKGLEELAGHQAALESARENLRQKLEALRAQQAEIGARMAAAEARLRLREAMDSSSSEVAAIGRAQERIEEQMAVRAARAEAVEELGLLDSGPDDRLEREISRLERTHRVDQELERIRREALAEQRGATRGGSEVE